MYNKISQKKETKLLDIASPDLNNHISVVIPAYNAEDSIQKAIVSLHKQSFKPLEIIVVDDGSQDKTAEVARGLASKVIRIENRGPAAARNTGIQYAKGEIIALIDSDCQANEDWLENINRVFHNGEILVVMGKVVLPASNYLGNSISALGFPAGGSLGFEKVWRVTPEGFTHTLSTCNCAFRREIFQKFGQFDEDFPYAGGEDTLFAANIVKAGIKIKYSPEIKVLHKPRSSFISFLRWQLQRGKCAYMFKKKAGSVGSFTKTRLWATKNVITTYRSDKKFPLVLLLLFLSYALQGVGFLMAFAAGITMKKRMITTRTAKEIKAWYDQEYVRNPNRFVRNWKEYYRFINPINPEEGKRLLDVACGTGGLLKAAKEKGLVSFGLDISTEGVFLAGKFSGCKRLIVANGENLPYRDNSFDYITNVGSLEHFLNPTAGLREMIRVLKTTGKMCVVLPNSFSFFGKLIGYRGTGQITERLATLREWKVFLEAEKLRVISVHNDLGPAILHDKKPLKALIRLAAKCILPFLPKSCAYQFIFVCQKDNTDSCNY